VTLSKHGPNSIYFLRLSTNKKHPKAWKHDLIKKNNFWHHILGPILSKLGASFYANLRYILNPGKNKSCKKFIGVEILPKVEKHTSGVRMQ
jgi:hypothetical protein